MPHITRRGSQRMRPMPNIGRYYRPAKRQAWFSFFILKIAKLPRRFLLVMGTAVIVVALVTTGIVLLSHKGSKPTGGGSTGVPGVSVSATDPTVTLGPRQAALTTPLVTTGPVAYRNISFGSVGLQLKEKQINQPSVFGNEIFYSAGTGSINSGAVLKSLFIYNIQSNQEKKIVESKVSYGEYYDPQINKDWLVWVETDHHDKNYIYVMDRKTNLSTQIRSCKNGMPKLRLAGNTLIWMEPVDKNTNQLLMYDLKTQEIMSLSNFTDVVTYGVSAPCVYDEDVTSASSSPGAFLSPTPTTTPTPTPTPTPTATPKQTAKSSASPKTSPTATPAADDSDNSDGEDQSDTTDNSRTTVVWAGHDPSQTADQVTSQGEHSAIFWVLLDQNAVDANGNINKQTFSTGTYVHEPVYNGKYFAWIDGNYAPNSKLYLSQPNGKPQVIDQGITTYSLGDGILVYGKGEKVWVYVIATGEKCCLTGGDEKGILPYVNGRTVVWYDITDGTGSDSLRYEILTDQELTPGANG